MCLRINETKKWWSRFCYERLCYHTKIIYCSCLLLYIYIWRARMEITDWNLKNYRAANFFKLNFFKFWNFVLEKKSKIYYALLPLLNFIWCHYLSSFCFCVWAKILLINSVYSAPLNWITSLACYAKVFWQEGQYVSKFSCLYLESRVEITLILHCGISH